MRSQLLCLTAYLDPSTASRAAYLFAALSRACHYHPYELAPTAAELTSWLDQAAQIVTQLQQRARCPLHPASENLYAERTTVPAPAQTPRVPCGTPSHGSLD